MKSTPKNLEGHAATSTRSSLSEPMPFESSNPVYGKAAEVCRTLQAAGYEALLAGGCVRDRLLGRDPKDYDVATSATPDQVEALFPCTVDVGRSFGVIRVLIQKQDIEVATFREDAMSSDGRHPDHVTFSTAEADAQRRDFTINGMFYDPERHQLIDYVHGQADAQAGILRAIGVAEDRFEEDYLRLLRAARFAATLTFIIDENTRSAIVKQSGHILAISPERIEHELTRILTEAPKAGQALNLLWDLALLPHVLPEVCDLAGQAQPPQFHPEGDVFKHTCLMLDAMDNASPTLAYAVLLHDIGKPATATTSLEPDGTERIRFNGHDKRGAAMAEDILTRLRMPRRLIDDVVHCVANHMRFMHVKEMRRATLRRLMGAATFPVELELHRLDCLCSHGDTSNVAFLLAEMERFEAEPLLPNRWITGRDVMARGVPEGPSVGYWVQTCYDRQLEGESGSRADLLAWLDQQPLIQMPRHDDETGSGEPS